MQVLKTANINDSHYYVIDDAKIEAMSLNLLVVFRLFLVFKQKVRAFAQSWLDENKNLTTCDGLTYWDGHNWQTVIVPCDNGDELTHEIVTDPALIALQNRSFVKEGFGEEIYKSNNGYYVIDFYIQGIWAYYITIPFQTKKKK